MKRKPKIFSAAVVVALLGFLSIFCYGTGGIGRLERHICFGDGVGGACFSGITLRLNQCVAGEFAENGVTISHQRHAVVGQAFEEITQSVYDAPRNTIKSYMPYQAITNRATEQYRMQRLAYTDEHGIRKVENRYCIAVGSGYTTEIGTWIDLVLVNGTVIPCILADQKDDRHTDASHRITFDGSLAEFVVDVPSLGPVVRHYGDISKIDPAWDSFVAEVVIYNINEEF